MSRSPHVEIYRESSELWQKYVPRCWRWRFRSSNGRILSQSSESYSDPRDLVRGLELSFPGWLMRDRGVRLEGIGGWYLWPERPGYPDPIPVRVPDGTNLLWRARRRR